MFDEATWVAVTKRVQQRARRYVNNSADAQDLTQESMQAALHQSGLCTRADLLGYCLGALRRQVAAYYRHRRYWRMVPLAAHNEPVTHADPAVRLAQRETVQKAARLAGHLDADERLLLSLLLQDCPRAQLAERLGLTRARLRQRYHRLMQKLRRVDRSGPHRLGV